MPYVNIKLIEGQCNLKQKQKIISTITDLIVDVMNRDRNYTSIVIDEVKPSSWAIGGKAVNIKKQSVSLININVSKGTTNPDEIAIMIKRCKESMSEIMDNHIDCNYFIIDELNSDAWGFGDIVMSERGRREANK